MATTGEFHDYILEHLQKVGLVTTRKMMGEYCVYYQAEEDLEEGCRKLKRAKTAAFRFGG